MEHGHWPFIVTELILVFGGAMAFAWWQFRDLKRERLKREAQRARESREPTDSHDERAPRPD